MKQNRRKMGHSKRGGGWAERGSGGLVFKEAKVKAWGQSQGSKG